MTEFITFVLSNSSVSFFVLGLLVSGVVLLVKQAWDRATVIETLLNSFLLWAIGFYFLYNFVVHVFFAEMAAEFIGWENSPFQYEVGYASLGFGVVAVLAHRSTLQFKLAALLGPAFFLWGAAAGHIYQIITAKNFAPGNAGLVLWTDLFLPVVGLALLYLSLLYPKSRNPPSTPNHE
jgi:hypothetical protein